MWSMSWYTQKFIVVSTVWGIIFLASARTYGAGFRFWLLCSGSSIFLEVLDIYILNSLSCFCSHFFLKGTKFHVNCSQRWHQITSRTNSNLHINSRSTGGAGFHLNCYFPCSWPGGLCLVREKLTCFVLSLQIIYHHIHCFVSSNIRPVWLPHPLLKFLSHRMFGHMYGVLNID